MATIITFNVKDISDNHIQGLNFTAGDGSAESVKNSPFTHEYTNLDTPLIALFDRLGYKKTSQLIQGTTIIEYNIILLKVLYCSVSEIRDQININARGVSELAFSNSLIEAYIKKAESIINTYISSRYVVPISTIPIPEIVKTICSDLTIYFILRTLFTKDSVNRSEYPDEYLFKHLNTEKETGTLYDIKNNKISILDENGNEIPTNIDPIKSNVEDYKPIFDIDDPLDWKEDTNQLEAIADERENT